MHLEVLSSKGKFFLRCIWVKKKNDKNNESMDFSTPGFYNVPPTQLNKDDYYYNVIFDHWIDDMIWYILEEISMIL